MSTLPIEILFPVQFLVQDPFNPTTPHPAASWFQGQVDKAIKIWKRYRVGIGSWGLDPKQDAADFFEDLQMVCPNPPDFARLRVKYAPDKGSFVCAFVKRECGLTDLPPAYVVPDPEVLLLLAGSYMHMPERPSLYGTQLWFPVAEDKTRRQIVMERNPRGSTSLPLEMRLCDKGKVTQRMSWCRVYAVVWKPNQG